MPDINPTTPQLKIVKAAMDAIGSRDMKIIEQFLSKDFVFKTSPKTTDLPDLPRKDYLLKFEAAFSVFSDCEVRIQCQGSPSVFRADIYITARSLFMK